MEWFCVSYAAHEKNLTYVINWHQTYWKIFLHSERLLIAILHRNLHSIKCTKCRHLSEFCIFLLRLFYFRFNVSELSDVGDIIGQVKAEDKDSVDTHLKVYYSILSGNEEGIFLIFFFHRYLKYQTLALRNSVLVIFTFVVCSAGILADWVTHSVCPSRSVCVVNILNFWSRGNLGRPDTN